MCIVDKIDGNYYNQRGDTIRPLRDGADLFGCRCIVPMCVSQRARRHKIRRQGSIICNDRRAQQKQHFAHRAVLLLQSRLCPVSV